MRPDDVLEFVHTRPFQPFRLTLTDGRTLDVRHPEMAMVGKTVIVVGVPERDEERPVFDRAVTVSLLHIMQAELIDGTVQN